jgi:hypothetical protein
VAKKTDPATAAFLPPSIPGRLEYVGVSLYGACWRAKLAAGLGIGRTTLHQLCTGGKRDPNRDIDAEIAALIDRERDLSAERSVSLTSLRNRFLRVKKVSA